MALWGITSTTVGNSYPAGTLEWWRQRLIGKLLARNRDSLAWWSYYYTDYPPPEVESDYQDAYRLLLYESRHAWAKLITSTINERLSLSAFTVGDEALSLQIWRDFARNHMNADQRNVHLDSIITGYGYVSVWPVGGDARVRAESAVQTVHEPDPDDPRAVRAALKLFFDDTVGQWRSVLTMPDGVYEWVLQVDRDAEGRWDGNVDWQTGNQDWQADEVYENPFNAVPIVPFINEPDMLRHGHSEIEPLESTLRRIDRLSLDLLLAAETAAFRQKWATGLKIPKDPVSGEPVQPFNVALDKLWVTPSENAKFGNFDATELEGYIRALSEAVSQLAAISRVPAHYLLSDSLANPPSAESLDAAEAGLLAKVEDRQDWFGESWEQVVRLMMIADSDYTTDQEVLADVGVVWEQAQRKNTAAMADSAVKWQAVGIPREVIWAKLGASPAEIVQWRQMAIVDTLEKQLLAPPAEAPMVDTTPLEEPDVRPPVANQLPNQNQRSE